MNDQQILDCENRFLPNGMIKESSKQPNSFRASCGRSHLGIPSDEKVRDTYLIRKTTAFHGFVQT